MPDIILHLGAHKTATTSVQRTLANNRDILTAHGILVPELTEFRKKISTNLRWYKFDNTAEWPLGKLLENEFSAAEIENCQTVVLSDENIIGYSGFIFSEGNFYTEIGERCRMFKNWLGKAPDKILFSIRPYQGFFLSGYSQWIRTNQQVDSRKIAKKTVLDIARGWAEIIEDIRDVFPHSDLVLTEYRRRKEFTLAQLNLLVGAVSVELSHDKKMFWNKGLTIERLIEMEELLASGSATQDRVDAINHQKIWGWPAKKTGFWTDQETRCLNEKYQRDKDSITKMSNVELCF